VSQRQFFLRRNKKNKEEGCGAGRGQRIALQPLFRLHFFLLRKICLGLRVDKAIYVLYMFDSGSLKLSMLAYGPFEQGQRRVHAH
jgi:hypothetical protein